MAMMIAFAVVAFFFLFPIVYQSRYNACDATGKCTEVTVLSYISYRVVGYGGSLHFPVRYDFGASLTTSGGFNDRDFEP
jgi:hypothetical protein